MTYLLDTNIVSKLRTIKKKPEPALSKWISLHQESQYFLSVLTIGEIHKGICMSCDSQQKRILEEWLWASLVPRFFEKILTIDTDTMSCWGELCASHSKRGVNLPSIDSLLAATAIHKNLILVSQDGDFEKVLGLKLFNPWKDGN